MQQRDYFKEAEDRVKQASGNKDYFAEAEQKAGIATVSSHAPPVDEAREALRAKLGPMADLILGTQAADTRKNGIQSWIADPEHQSNLGGITGGTMGLPFGPAGAMGGAFLGGTAGSLMEGKGLWDAAREGATESSLQGIGGLIGSGLAAVGRPLMKAGKAIVRRSFGPQAKVATEFGEDIRGDMLDQLTQRKLDETPIMAPVGGRTAPNLIQRKIEEEGVNPRALLMASHAGDRAAAPRAAFNPVETPEGTTIHPLKDVYDRAFGQTNVRDDVKSIGNVVRGATATPTGAGPGSATINNPRMMEYAERQTTALRPLPPELQGNYTPEAEAAIRRSLGPEYLQPAPSTWTPRMRGEMPARDMQEMVTGNYRKLDTAGAFANEPSPSASRDALKALTRGLKEEYTRVVPEAVPFNQRIAALIPLREALTQAEAQGHSGALVRLGETFALGGGRPGLAVGSLANRPRLQSMGGQAMYETGKRAAATNVPRNSALTANALRLLVAQLLSPSHKQD